MGEANRNRVTRIAQAREAKEMGEHAANALMVLVRRAWGPLDEQRDSEGVRVTLEELQALRAGDGVSIQVDSEGLLLTFVGVGEAPPKAG